MDYLLYSDIVSFFYTLGMGVLFFLVAEYLPYKLDLEQKIDVWRGKYDDGEISRLGLFFAPVWRYPR